MQKRKPLSDIDRSAVWSAFKSSCADCHKKLYENYTLEDCKKDFSTIKEIKVYSYFKPCYACGNNTKIITYDFVFLETFHIGSINKLDLYLMKKYPENIKKIYSYTAGQEEIANVCNHCGKLQGNWYVMEDLIQSHSEEEYEGELGENVFDVIPNFLDFSDVVDERNFIAIRDILDLADYLDFVDDYNEIELKDEIIYTHYFKGHIHHIDHNPLNDDLKNLVLLCPSCHIKRHKNHK